MTNAKRSPLKDEPLPLPGESGRRRLNDVIVEKAVLPMTLAVFAIYAAGFEWFRMWRDWQPDIISALMFTVVALGVCIWAASCIRSALTESRRLGLGVRGEAAMAEVLAELRPLGYRALHDLPGQSWNVDHVLVGPSGVYTIETKTLNKPARGFHDVVFDGEQVTVDGLPPDRDPIVQAKAQGRWLSDLIRKETGRKQFVQPVVLYPGWYVHQPPPDVTPKVWVLHPDMLGPILQHQPKRLNEDAADSSTLSLRSTRGRSDRLGHRRAVGLQRGGQPRPEFPLFT